MDKLPTPAPLGPYFTVVGYSVDPERCVVLSPDGQAIGLLQSVALDINANRNTVELTIGGGHVRDSDKPLRMYELYKAYPDLCQGYSVTETPDDDPVFSHYESMTVIKPSILLVPDASVMTALVDAFVNHPSSLPDHV